MPPRPPPPYQLLKHDRYNIALGVASACLLASLKKVPGLPRMVQWQLNAFTNWNVTFILLRFLLDQPQWDPFLAVNSVGVAMGFRTAMAQGLDDNMRTKLRRLGMDLPRPVFVAADHGLHTLPAVAYLAKLVYSRQRIPAVNSIYALMLASWFSFRQSASLDGSDIYVPHPWRRAWFAIITSLALTPRLVDALLAKRKGRTLLLLAAMAVPYLSTRLDPGLRAKYNFEARLQRMHENGEAEDEGSMKRKAAGGRAGFPRVMSEAAPTSRWPSGSPGGPR